MAEQQSEIIGKLQVEVVQAKGIIVTPGPGKIGIYATLTLDNQKEKTRVVEICETPEWHQTFSIAATKPFGPLEILFWLGIDAIFNPIAAAGGAAAAADECLGRAAIHLVDLADQKPHRQWYSLTARAEKDKYVGPNSAVELSLQYKYKSDWDAVYKGALALSKDSYGVALRYLNEALRRFPDSERLYGLRSEAYLRQKQYKEALQDANQAITINPNWAEGYYRIGQVFFEIEEFDQAEEAYQRGLKYQPNDERLKKALQDIQRNALKKKVRVAITAAKAHFEQARYDDAVVQFSAAIEGNPANSVYYVYRAIAELGANRYADAQEDALKVPQLAPDWLKTDPAMAGFLTKAGERRSARHHRRWFVLKEYFLYYFESDKASTMPKGVVCIHGVSFKRRGKQFKIVVPAINRTYELKADSEMLVDSWIDVLQKVCERPLALPMDPNENKFFWVKGGGGAAAAGGGGGPRKPNNLFSGIASNLSMGLQKGILIPGKLIGAVHGKIDAALTSISMESVDADGWLYKLGDLNQEWKRRWFILKNSDLFYFDQKQSSKPQNVTPKGVISLESAVFVPKSTQSAEQYAFDIIAANKAVITQPRTFTLRAESEEDYKRWKEALVKVAGEAREENVVEEDVLDDTPPAVNTNNIGTNNAADIDMAGTDASATKVDNGELQTASDTSSSRKRTAADSSAPPPVAVPSPQRLPGARLGANAMSSSEGRFFSKFGLTPPVHEVEALPADLFSINGSEAGSEPSHPQEPESQPLLSPPPKEKTSSCCTCSLQ